MTRTRPPRAVLDAAFEQAIRWRLVAPTRRRWFHFFRERPPAVPVNLERIFDVLDRHSPIDAQAIEPQIRRATETQFPTPRHIGNFDEYVRNVARLSLDSDPQTAHALMTIWNGHVRELAVRALRDTPSPFRLALLLIRTNDWVTHVRAAACKKLQDFAPRLPDDTIAACAEMIWRFERAERLEAPARALIRDLLERPGVIARLRTNALEGGGQSAITHFRHLLRTPALDADLAHTAQTHHLPAIRALAADAALTRVIQWRIGKERHRREIQTSIDGLALAYIIAADRAAPVRRAAAQYLAAQETLAAKAVDVLLALAQDRNSSVAEIAQARLTNAGVAWIEQVRAALQRAPSPGLARTLGEVGDSDDGETLWRIAETLNDTDAMPYLAAAARRGNETATTRLRTIALTNPDLSLARRAAKALSLARARFDASDLKQAATHGEEFLERGLVRHLRPHSAATWIIVLARLEAARAPLQAKLWRDRAMRKLNRGAFAPSAAETREIKSALERAPQFEKMFAAFGI